MSTQIITAFVDQFKANIMLPSQQEMSRLRGTCRPESVTGDTMYVEKIGYKDAALVTTRHGDTPISDTSHSRIKLSMADYEVPADLIDQPDRLKLLADPQSSYAITHRMALQRAIDDVVIAALGGTAYTGHAGATAVNYYDSGECRCVDGDGTVKTAGSDHTNTTATALTIAKLLTCKQLLDAAEISEQRQRYFVTNAYNLAQLLNTTEVKSADYNTVKALAAGQVDTFMGFKFIRSERLVASTTDTSCTRCYAFAQDAVALAVAQEPKVDISIRNDKRGATQVYSSLSIGAARVEGPAVVSIYLSTSGST